MRILMIEPYVDIDGNTGDSTHVKELAFKLSDRGIDVTLVARSSQRTNVTKQHLHFLNVNIGKHKSIGIDMHRAVSALMAFLLAFAALLRLRFDLIHERQPFPIGVILGGVFAVTTVTEINAFIPDELGTLEFNRKVRLGSSFIKKLYSIFEHVVLARSDKIIVVSPELRTAIQGRYRIGHEKIFVLQNGVNIDVFRPKAVSMKNLGLCDQCKYVCFVGNLNKARHAVQVVIEAFPIILKSVPSAKMMIVGDGVLRQLLARRVHEMGLDDRFDFVGSVSYANLPLYINAARVCVAPYRYTSNFGSPLKIYEYLACSKPVVATDVGEVGRLLRTSESGIPVPAENVSEFAYAVIQLLRDERLARRMGENGRRFVVENSSWEVVVTKLLAIVTGRSESEIPLSV
jgi:glycosyltransferase involved in cell wall biosynthesis